MNSASLHHARALPCRQYSCTGCEQGDLTWNGGMWPVVILCLSAGVRPPHILSWHWQNRQAWMSRAKHPVIRQ